MSIFVCNLKQTSAIETEFNKNISIKNINESFKVDENLEINANAFVRFFGVKYSTKSFISFADNVKKGSFVRSLKKRRARRALSIRNRRRCPRGSRRRQSSGCSSRESRYPPFRSGKSWIAGTAPAPRWRRCNSDR